jgi:MFS family permease
MRAGVGTPTGRGESGELSVDTVVAVAQVALGFMIGALGACLILLARDLDVARTRLSWLSAGFGVALLVAGPVGPPLLARGGHRVLRVSAAVLGAGAIALALAPGLIVAQLGALLLGIGGAGIVLATPTLLTGPTAAHRISRVSAVASVAGGMAPLALSATDLLPGSGRLALLLPVPLLAWLCVNQRLRPPDPGPSPTAPAGADSGPPRTTADDPVPANPIPDDPIPDDPIPDDPIPDDPGLDDPGLDDPGLDDPGLDGQLRVWRVVARWAAMVLAVTTEFAFAVWAAARLQDSGLAVSGAAAAAAAFSLGMAAGRFAAAWLLDRVPVVPLSAALVLVGTVVLIAPAGPVLCTGALALAGLGIAVLYPVTLASLMHEPGLTGSHAAALGATASGTAIVVGPLVMGLVSAATTLRTAFLIVIPLLFGLLVLSRPARSPEGARPTVP